MTTTAPTPSSCSVLLWPPPNCPEKYDGQRVDLLALIPPNRFDDLNLPNREQHVAGLTLRADRVIMDRQRYGDCERMTQHKLSDDIQASCREQGHVISVKEWADKNQHRGTLRLRLRCRSSACRFQFQLNWDSKAGFWYISRRRCGTFVHTCQAVQANGAPTQVSSLAGKRCREKGTTSYNNKRAKQQEGTKKNQAKDSLSKDKVQGAPESAVLDALDSARSLLDLSRAPSSPVPTSPTATSSTATNEENKNPQERTSPVSAAVSLGSNAGLPSDLMRYGDRLYISPLLSAPAPAAAAAALSMQHKLALLRSGCDLQEQQRRLELSNAALKAAVLQQRCMALAPTPAAGQALLQDPRLLRTGLLMNGGAYANI